MLTPSRLPCFCYKLPWLIPTLFFLLLKGHSSLYAQELEPRAYSNLPIGMNFLLLGYGYSEGGLLFDPSVPIQGAQAQTDIGILAYARAFSLRGNSAKFAIITPYAGLFANGFLEGQYREREVDGFADPSFAVTYSFLGAPALSLDEFRHFQQTTIAGMTLKITAPLGQYDADRLLNLGTNRWTIKPEVGVSRALGKWLVEGAAAVSLYTSNSDFFGGQKLEQDPIYSIQGHVIYTFTPGIWAALDATYYTGGITTLDGIEKDNKLDNWRFGLTLALPIDQHNSIKLAGSTGIATRTGTDFDAFLLAWQLRWGAGL